jgi:hypothetical protein
MADGRWHTLKVCSAAAEETAEMMLADPRGLRKSQALKTVSSFPRMLAFSATFPSVPSERPGRLVSAFAGPASPPRIAPSFHFLGDPP